VIQTRFPTPYSEADYRAELDRCLEGQGDEARLFALRCQRFRERMPDVHCDLLFIPVGKAHQGPIVACLACPARQVVLLCSPETVSVGEQIEESLADDFAFRIVSINPVDGQQVVDVVQAHFQAHGCPEQVVCDQTGGKKPTTSTLAALAAINNWRLLYVDTQHPPRRDRPGVVVSSEEVLWLPNLFDCFGGLHRLVAEACVEGRAFRPALQQLELALETSVASAPLLKRLQRVKLAQRFREGDVGRFLSGLRSQRKRWKSQLEALQTDPTPLQYWMVHTLWREGQKLAASGLAYAIWGHTDVPAALKAYRAQNPALVGLAKPLNEAFGTGFTWNG